MRKTVQYGLIMDKLLKQDPRCDIDYFGVQGRVLLQSYLVPNQIAQIAPQLHSHSPRQIHCRHSPRLRADHAKFVQLTLLAVLLIKELRHLRAFPTARFSRNYQNFTNQSLLLLLSLTLLSRRYLDDFLFHLEDRQLLHLLLHSRLLP